MLTKEIEALLAGKDLASETIAKYEESMKKQEASGDAAPDGDVQPGAVPDPGKESALN